MAKNNLLTKLAFITAVGTTVLGGCASMDLDRQIREADKRYEAQKEFSESGWQEGVVTDTGKGYVAVGQVDNNGNRTIAQTEAEREARESIGRYVLDGSSGRVVFSSWIVTERMFTGDSVYARVFVPYSAIKVKSK